VFQDVEPLDDEGVVTVVQRDPLEEPALAKPERLP